MAATKDDLKKWYISGKKQGATHIIIVCDTYDWDDYPVFIKPGADVKEIYAEYTPQIEDGVLVEKHPMQKVMEVYNLDMTWEEQENGRVMNF